LCGTTIDPIASPVRFALVQGKSFCAGARQKRLKFMARKSSKMKVLITIDNTDHSHQIPLTIFKTPKTRAYFGQYVALLLL
jgi:hypothetical protein